MISTDRPSMLKSILSNVMDEGDTRHLPDPQPGEVQQQLGVVAGLLKQGGRISFRALPA